MTPSDSHESDAPSFAGCAAAVSFDLYVIEREDDLTLDELYELLEADEGKDLRQAGPGPRTAALLQELEHRWPGPDEDPDASPWSSWPLWQPEGQDVGGFNIAFSWADEVLPVMVEGCRRHGLVLFDPQGEQVHTPRRPRNRWNPFKRKPRPYSGKGSEPSEGREGWKTAAELMAELEADEEWVRARQEDERKRRERFGMEGQEAE